MKILMLTAAVLLLGGCATYPGYQYSNGYYRGETVYDDGYPPVYESGYDAYGWPYRSAFYGGYGYGGYGYDSYGYNGATVIYDRGHRRHYRGRSDAHDRDHRGRDHRGHWRPHEHEHHEYQHDHGHHGSRNERAPVYHAPQRIRSSQPDRRMPSPSNHRRHEPADGSVHRR